MSDISDLGKTSPVDIDLPDGPGVPHIVDRLIAERGTKLVNSRIWPIAKPILYRILHYREAVKMADTMAPLSGQRALDHTSGILELDIRVTGLERVPRTGAFILAANHPTGIADGIAVFDAVKAVRRDLAIFANRDAVRINQHFTDVLIPVEWRREYRSRSKTKEALRLTVRAFNEQRAVVIFPAGRIGYWRDGRLNERDWQSSIVTLARKHGVPVLPVHVGARNSWLFYWFANWNTELRDMTVFHELLNKRGKTFHISIGQLIENASLDGDLVEVTRRLQHHVVERIPADADALFASPLHPSP